MLPSFGQSKEDETNGSLTAYHYHMTDPYKVGRTTKRRKEHDMDLSNVPEELKQEARACRTPEDFLRLAKKGGFELTDEQLDGIYGGVAMLLNPNDDLTNNQ